jgi:hypothetical protein
MKITVEKYKTGIMSSPNNSCQDAKHGQISFSEKYKALLSRQPLAFNYFVSYDPERPAFNIIQ